MSVYYWQPLVHRGDGVGHCMSRRAVLRGPRSLGHGVLDCCNSRRPGLHVRGRSGARGVVWAPLPGPDTRADRSSHHAANIQARALVINIINNNAISDIKSNCLAYLIFIHTYTRLHKSKCALRY